MYDCVFSPPSRSVFLYMYPHPLHTHTHFTVGKGFCLIGLEREKCHRNVPLFPFLLRPPPLILYCVHRRSTNRSSVKAVEDVKHYVLQLVHFNPLFAQFKHINSFQLCECFSSSLRKNMHVLS